MNERLEILLFDMCEMYKSVHHSARRVCSARGIALRELDLDEHRDLANAHQVRHFPQWLLFREGRLVGETHSACHTPTTFAAWLDESLSAGGAP